ncbi:MAG TPA: hypothetical protein VH120_14950 [Gemmataceae bacterium]|jgi:hypothetical protein|nr:hypothetical protein [Gemmataceae bacterium]
MTRRRQMLVTVVGLAAVVVVWSHALWQRRQAEQQLVGRWQRIDPDIAPWMITKTLFPDGQAQDEMARPEFALPPCYWSVQGQRITFDYQPPQFPRIFQPLLRLLGVGSVPGEAYLFEVNGDRLVITGDNGNREVYVRIPSP